MAPPAPRVRPLRPRPCSKQILREQRAEERTRMLAALEFNRYQQLVDSLARALQSTDAPTRDAAARPAAAVLPGLCEAPLPAGQPAMAAHRSRLQRRRVSPTAHPREEAAVYRRVRRSRHREARA
ncbi:MAG: hypothetical protein U5Q44_15870 [Dehalococcoidia bacterium]|nr:hypothetical protein [Dehalococcoidia bacterium]